MKMRSSYYTGCKISLNLSYITVRKEEKMERTREEQDSMGHRLIPTHGLSLGGLPIP
jgi:hypothetical protein